MPDSPTTLDNLYQAFLDEANDSRLDKITYIRMLNRLMFRMNITKPAEQLSKIFYLDGYEKYQIPSNGFRSVISLYSENLSTIFYVSPFRYRLKDPYNAITDQVSNNQRFLNIRLNTTSSKMTLFTMADNLTADGSWVPGTGVGNLKINTVTKKDGAGSLSFDLTAVTYATMWFTRTIPVDITSFTEWMRSRFEIWLPTAPTSITIRIGSSIANYYEQTVTAQANGESFTILDANEIEFSKENSTLNGTVDEENINTFYLMLTFASPTTDTGFLLNKIKIGRPELLDLEWYTNYIAKTSAGVLQQSITENASTTDELIIKDYSDYISTVLDGLLYDFLKVKDPERAKNYYARWIGEKDPNGHYVNGMGFLEANYPSRRANYKRMTTLPDLGYGLGRSNSRFCDDDDV